MQNGEKGWKRWKQVENGGNGWKRCKQWKTAKIVKPIKSSDKFWKQSKLWKRVNNDEKNCEKQWKTVRKWEILGKRWTTVKNGEKL